MLLHQLLMLDLVSQQLSLFSTHIGILLPVIMNAKNMKTVMDLLFKMMEFASFITMEFVLSLIQLFQDLTTMLYLAS